MFFCLFFLGEPPFAMYGPARPEWYYSLNTTPTDFDFFFKAGASLVVHNLIQFMNYDFFVKNLYYDSIVTC